MAEVDALKEYTPSSNFNKLIHIYIINFLLLLLLLLTSLSIQGSKLTFLLGSTGAPNFKKLGAPKIF